MWIFLVIYGTSSPHYHLVLCGASKGTAGNRNLWLGSIWISLTTLSWWHTLVHEKALSSEESLRNLGILTTWKIFRYECYVLAAFGIKCISAISRKNSIPCFPSWCIFVVSVKVPLMNVLWHLWWLFSLHANNAVACCSPIQFKIAFDN